MKNGDRIVAEVAKLSAQGDGIACVNGRDVVLEHTVPGDQVEGVVCRKRKGHFEATVDRYLVWGSQRIPARCPHFGVCGGCRWQDLEYAEQLRLKVGMVRAALESREIILPELEPILPSPAPFFYRNKMEFSFGLDQEGHLQLGLHVRGRFNRVFDLEICHLQSEVSNRLVAAVRRYAQAGELSVYNLRTHQGLLRFLVIRESKKTREVMVNLVVSEYPSEGVQRLTEKVLGEIPEITTWIVTRHGGKAQVAVGQEEFILHGPGYILENCGGVEYEISPRSFFQTNSLQAERLYGTIVALAGELAGAKVLDLYCGIGGISLQLAYSAGSVLGIEAIPEAVADAGKNALRNRIGNCHFIAGFVEYVLGGLEDRHLDMIVLDPPRTGVHKRVLETLGRLRVPRLIYVSCNPFTLGEDLASLGAKGYRIATVQPVDMFPQTPHCEVITELVHE